MKINATIKSNAKTDKIEELGENCFKIWVKETPIEGKANHAIIKVVADYFGVTASRISIISGRASKQKIIEII